MCIYIYTHTHTHPDSFFIYVHIYTRVYVYIYTPRFRILPIQPNTNLDIPVKGSAGVIKVQKLWKASWLVDLIT